MKLNVTLFALIIACAISAHATFYIDSAVLGHLAIPAILAGSGYGLIGLGKVLGAAKGLAVGKSHGAALTQSGVAKHVHPHVHHEHAPHIVYDHHAHHAPYHGHYDHHGYVAPVDPYAHYPYYPHAHYAPYPYWRK